MNHMFEDIALEKNKKRGIDNRKSEVWAGN